MKRFTDTLKYQKPWFRKLSAEARALFDYLICMSDAAGVSDIDYELASIDTRLKITPAHMAELGEHVKAFNGSKILVTRFISFQYGKLSRLCPPHKAVFEAIKKHGLIAEEDGSYSPVSK